ncbi:histidine kinase [Sutcliffiella halmapala]
MEKLRGLLYLSAVLLVGIPTLIVIASDDSFSSTFSNILISIAIVNVMLAKLVTVFEKRKENRRFSVDIGTIIGLSIVLIIRFI